MRPTAFFLLGLAAASPAAADESPYAGQELREIKSLSASEVRSLGRGDGMGFAKLAELNHYPGPKHVLELATELELTPEQLADTEALFAEMHANATRLGRDLLAAEAALDRAFAENEVDADSLEQALLGIGEIRARLRYVHLEAHLRQRHLLTDTQVALYDELRGYAGTGTDHAAHPGHHEQSHF